MGEHWNDIHYLILYAVVSLAFGLLGKIVWDWLTNRNQKKENGHLERRLDKVDKIAVLIEDMQERQKKMWEHMLEERRKT